ncbi:hypothetical protein ACFLZ2_02020 [Candidatus Margulisiibacteriota bacterium]
MKKAMFLLITLLFLSGCGEKAPPPQINVFKPVDLPSNIAIVVEGKVPYAVRDHANYTVKAALYEYKNIYVAEVAIQNKTKTDIATEEYSISLVDGKDRKPLMMMSLESIREALKKSEVGESGGAGSAEQKLTDAVISLFRETKPSDEKLVRKGLELTLERYFAFRPIWAGKSRDGFIVFNLDFRLDHPLTLAIELPDEKIDIVFKPSEAGIEL